MFANHTLKKSGLDKIFTNKTEESHRLTDFTQIYHSFTQKGKPSLKVSQIAVKVWQNYPKSMVYICEPQVLSGQRTDVS